MASDKRPCGCTGAHVIECYIGGKMMASTIDTLSWLLDENMDMDRLVEEIDKDMKS